MPENSEPIRLSKLMAQRGLCSRREADRFIENGWVEVDGKVIDQLGTRVSPDAAIRLKPQARRQQESTITVLLNKPIGYVSGQPEDGYPAAVNLVTARNRQQGDRGPRINRAPGGLAPAGRLDIDSTGLLVLTQDGRIARQLIGADSEVEKEYLVRVEGHVDKTILERLHHGLSLDGKPLKPAKVEILNDDQLRFVLIEGKKRQIRRMCEQVGLLVTGLKRVRIGQVRLGNLPEGQWRLLRAGERF